MGWIELSIAMLGVVSAFLAKRLKTTLGTNSNDL